MVRGRRPHERLGRWAFGAATAGAFAFMMLPIVLVIWLSVFADEIPSVPPTGYSTRWYAHLLTQRAFTGGFLTSLDVALIATAAGLLISLPASLALTRGRFRGQGMLLQLLTAPLIVPAIVIGGSLYIFFVEIEIATELPLTGSTLGLGLAHVLIAIPWCVRLLTASLTGLDRATEEAALSLGARPLTVLAKVTLPAIWPGLVAAALFSFVISFGNLEVSLFLVAPGETTLPIAILQYLQWKIDPTIAAVSTVQIAIIGGALLVTDRFVPLSRVV